MSRNNKNVFRLALTGGPCGGKTTALASIKEHFTMQGYKVFVIPEVPTIIINGGFEPREYIAAGALHKLQDAMFKIILSLEDNGVKLAEDYAKAYDKKCIVVFDRGVVDGKAYTTKKMWENILRKNKETEHNLKKRYDGVVHLVTAPEAFYTKENNPARQEDYGEAIVQDERTKIAWLGSKLSIINNEKSFSDKITRVIRAISNMVGAPDPREIERKFLLENINIEEILLERNILFELFEIEQVYLKSEEEWQESRLRASLNGESTTYYHTIKEPTDTKEIRIEKERILTKVEYELLLQHRDPEKVKIRKKRYAFIWKDQQYEVDVFLDKHKGLVLLEIETYHEESKAEIPDFLGKTEEVTHLDKFRNKELAKKT